MLRSQARSTHRAQDRAQREAISSTSPRGDSHFGALAQTGQREHVQRHTHVRVVSISQSHMHHVRVALDELVRVDQEEQIRRLLASASAQIHTFHTPVSRRSLQEQDHSLRSQTREHITQATRPEWHQSDRLRVELLRASANLHVHTISLLSSARGHTRRQVRHAHRHVESRVHHSRAAHGLSALSW